MVNMNVTISVNPEECTFDPEFCDTTGALDETRLTPAPYFENRKLMERVRPIVKQNLRKLMSINSGDCDSRDSYTEINVRSQSFEIEVISESNQEKENENKKKIDKAKKIQKFKFML